MCEHDSRSREAWMTDEMDVQFTSVKLVGAHTGPVIALHFECAEVDALRHDVSFHDLEGMAQELVPILAQARERLHPSEQQAVIAQDVASVRTRNTDSSRVVLSFQKTTGMQFHFSLDPSQASALAKQIEIAAVDAARTAPSTSMRQ
jgi:hypothetical protein